MLPFLMFFFMLSLLPKRHNFTSRYSLNMTRTTPQQLHTKSKTTGFQLTKQVKPEFISDRPVVTAAPQICLPDNIKQQNVRSIPVCTSQIIRLNQETN